MSEKTDWISRIKNLIVGKARNPLEPTVFHKVSLVAFFAWVGLGSDGLSSSCYGPQEAFVALTGHTHLSLIVALAAVITVFVISASYTQIVELFPAGGGGYVVASKLLSPTLGMVSGCALLIDYVLTITVSMASGAEALFSFMPLEWQPYRLTAALAGVLILTVLNLRGVKESVAMLIPVFLVFIATHAFAILAAAVSHLPQMPDLVRSVAVDAAQTRQTLGVFGMLVLILRAYSMGAGTYTGIEAVSNGLPILREPKQQTAKRTMTYMAWSLALVVFGLMLSYLLYQVALEPGKTLNAVLFERMTATWPNGWGAGFVWTALVSEAAILFVAAQAGFVDGPRVLANMALDRWVPTRFAMLSDRLVTQNGIVIMGTAAAVMMLATGGSVQTLVVLYAINVFITFFLSQLGMVRHWWGARRQERKWRGKFAINGVGLLLTTFILVSVIVLKFHEGGWVTLLVTGALVTLVAFIKRHYHRTATLLRRLDLLVPAAAALPPESVGRRAMPLDPEAKTAVLMVNGFNGLGLHTTLSVIRFFGQVFKQFVFVQVGIVDAGTFKGVAEMNRLQEQVSGDLARYVQYMRDQGYPAEAIAAVGTDVVTEVSQLAPGLLARYPHAVFFGGQLVFPKEGWLTSWLHNYTAFTLQRKFYFEGIPVVILPIRVV